MLTCSRADPSGRLPHLRYSEELSERKYELCLRTPIVLARGPPGDVAEIAKEDEKLVEELAESVTL